MVLSLIEVCPHYGQYKTFVPLISDEITLYMYGSLAQHPGFYMGGDRNVLAIVSFDLHIYNNRFQPND